jgi:hypothetical protein
MVRNGSRQADPAVGRGDLVDAVKSRQGQADEADDDEVESAGGGGRRGRYQRYRHTIHGPCASVRRGSSNQEDHGEIHPGRVAAIQSQIHQEQSLGTATNAYEIEQLTQVQMDRRGSVGAVDGRQEAAQPWRTGLVAGSDETKKKYPIDTCQEVAMRIETLKALIPC